MRVVNICDFSWPFMRLPLPEAILRKLEKGASEDWESFDATVVVPSEVDSWEEARPNRLPDDFPILILNLTDVATKNLDYEVKEGHSLLRRIQSAMQDSSSRPIL